MIINYNKLFILLILIFKILNKFNIYNKIKNNFKKLTKKIL